MELSSHLEKKWDKNRGKKKPELKTMAHPQAIGSLSYGGFTKVSLSIVQ